MKTAANDPLFRMMLSLERLGFCKIVHSCDDNYNWHWYTIDPERNETRYFAVNGGIGEGSLS